MLVTRKRVLWQEITALGVKAIILERVQVNMG